MILDVHIHTSMRTAYIHASLPTYVHTYRHAESACMHAHICTCTYVHGSFHKSHTIWFLPVSTFTYRSRKLKGIESGCVSIDVRSSYDKRPKA